jgi:hypothetical protein
MSSEELVSTLITRLLNNLLSILPALYFFLYKSVISKVSSSEVWWHMPIITAVGRLKQEDCEFQASLGYTTRPCLKKKKREKEKRVLTFCDC